MKLIIFAAPERVDSEAIVEELNKMAKNLGFITNLNIIENCDFSTKKYTENPKITILKDIIRFCGNPENRLSFTTNFYKAISEGFGTTKKDTKIILNEIITGKEDPNVVTFAKNNRISFIFDLAERTLGMLR